MMSGTPANAAMRRNAPFKAGDRRGQAADGPGRRRRPRGHACQAGGARDTRPSMAANLVPHPHRVVKPPIDASERARHEPKRAR